MSVVNNVEIKVAKITPVIPNFLINIIDKTILIIASEIAIILLSLYKALASLISKKGRIEIIINSVKIINLNAVISIILFDPIHKFTKELIDQ